MNPYIKMYLITESDKISLDEYKTKPPAAECLEQQQQPIETQQQQIPANISNLQALENLNKSITENISILKEQYNKPPASPAQQQLEETSEPPQTISSAKKESGKCKIRLKECHKQLEECLIKQWQTLDGERFSSNKSGNTPNTKLLPLVAQTRPKRIKSQPDRLILAQ